MRFSAAKTIVLLSLSFVSIMPVAAQYPCTLDPSRPVNGGIYKVGGEVQAPVPIATPDPKNPDTPMSSGVHKTRLWVVLDCTGVPALVRVYSPLSTELDKDSGELGSKAREEVLRWKFRPAVRRGQPTMVQFDVEFRFKFDTSKDSRNGSATHSIIYTPIGSTPNS